MKHTILILTMLIMTVCNYAATVIPSGTYPSLSWNTDLIIADNATVTISSANFNAGSLTVGKNATLTITFNTTLNGSFIINTGAVVNSNGFSTSGSKTQSFTNNGVLNVIGDANFSYPYNGNIGSVLSISGKLQVNEGEFTINEGASVNSTTCEFNNNNIITGSMTVSGRMDINSVGICFYSCGQLNVKDLYIHNDNLLTGKGFVNISGVYNNESTSHWSGHPLTQSTEIFIKYAGSNTTGFGNAYFSSSTNNTCSVSALPVTGLESFTGDSENEIYRFTWTTQQEENDDHFDLQSSSDGKMWAVIGTIASKAVNGNSSIPISYFYSYSNVQKGDISWVFIIGSIIALLILPFINKKLIIFPGICFMMIVMISCSKTNYSIKKTTTKTQFRLKQVDKNGTASYSRVVVLY